MTTTTPSANVDELTNVHRCRFDWCESDVNTYPAAKLEHYSTGEFIPATAMSLSGVGYTDRDPRNEQLLTFGVGLRCNEDLDASPYVFFNVSGGPDGEDTDYGLRLDEAVLLYNALGRAIIDGCKGTNLSPKRIRSFYAPEEA